ncbi:type III-B CRISPR-associated protein Cas10/Cmr2 [Hydrogenobaculum acidophilum]
MEGKHEELYEKKLKALIHDPPYKASNILGHFDDAKELFEALNINGALEDESVKIADQLASAQSRVIVKPKFQDIQNEKQFEKDSRVNYDECQFINIFSEEKEEVESPNKDEVINLYKRLGNLFSQNNNQDKARLIFLFLWCFYTEIFPEIEKHPADTRAPNHSIYDHLVQTSAITSALPKPAFLLFTIGPVQSFISKARKISDLWAGSYMLSYLIWKSMEPLVEELGLDVIIFPNLLGQPLVDKWLCEVFRKFPIADLFNADELEFLNNTKFREWFDGWYKCICNKNNNEDSNKDCEDIKQKLTIANLPNRFLAVIPYDERQANKCYDAFKKALEELAEKVYYEIDSIIPSGLDSSDNIENKLGNNIKQQLLAYFQVYWVIMPWSKDSGKYSPDDALSDYSKLFGKNEIYNTVKNIVENPYYKFANVGSAYSLLIELTEKLLGARKSLRDFEHKEYPGEEYPSEKCHLCGEYEVLNLGAEKWDKLRNNRPSLVSKDEKLCGICLTKRLFPDIIKDEIGLSDRVRFPSTPEMASIGEKKILSNDIKNSIKQAYDNFVLTIKSKNNDERLPKTVSVPKLANDTLYGIDGQFLMLENYRVNYFAKEYGIKVDESDFNEIVEILNSKDKKVNPSRYYAILQMDGDNMGKWLKGEFNSTIEKVLHEKVKNALISYWQDKDKTLIQKMLCSKHPMSPSLHQAFSRRLSSFALGHVRKIVEQDYWGKLVYAGGDDVLALLPVEEVLDCAYNLQKTFKSILSPKASMSAGIVIVHYKYPLYLALEEVNAAERRAKKHYGKNSFCLRFLSRSGEQRECGGTWDLVEFIDTLVCKLRSEQISSRFPYDYFMIVNELYDGQNNQKIKEVLKLELKRVFLRKIKDDGGIMRFFEEKMLNWFDKLDIYDFANLLLISEKISKKSNL